MKLTIIWIWGFGPGLLLGFLIRSAITFWTKANCRFVREVPGAIIPGRKSFQKCTGLPSVACIEKMCPTHCQEVHKEKCKALYFVERGFTG